MKNNVIRKILLGILISISIAFIIISISIFFDSRKFVSITGSIILMIGICLPITLSAFIYIKNLSNISKKYKVMKRVVKVLLFFYVLLLFIGLFMIHIREQEFKISMNISNYVKMNSNVIPFKTIIWYLQSYFEHSITLRTMILNLFGNMILLAPMGILLPILSIKQRQFKNFISTILLIIVTIEVLQLFTNTGRFDIDDLILNISGAVIFYGLYYLKFTQTILKKIYCI